MLPSEIRYTNVKDGVPGNLEYKTHKLGPLSLFGAAELKNPYDAEGGVP